MSTVWSEDTGSELSGKHYCQENITVKQNSLSSVYHNHTVYE